MNAINDMRQVVEKAKSHEYASGCEFRRCMDAALDRIERECIELPKDADGVPIKIGDCVEDEDGAFRVDGWFDWDGLGLWVFQRDSLQARADRCQHVKHDSWEQIGADADDVAPQEYCRSRGMDFFDVLDASEKMLADIVARCKALAGVE